MDEISFRRLRSQVIISMSSALALFVLSAVYGLSQISSIGANLKELAEVYIPLNEISTEIATNQLKQSVLVERALRMGEELAEKVENQHHLEKTLNEYLDIASRVDRDLTRGGKMVENALLKAHTEKVRESFRGIGQLLGNVEQEYRDIDHNARGVLELIRQRRQHEVLDLLGLIERGEERFTSELQNFLARVQGLTEQVVSNAEQAEDRAYIRMYILTGLAFSTIPVMVWRTLRKHDS